MSGPTITQDEILACLRAVEPLFHSMSEQLRGDWSSTEGQNERNQTFEEFLKCHQPRVQERMRIGIFCIGNLRDDIQIELLTEIVQAYSCVEVRDLGIIATAQIPKKAWRNFGAFVPQMNAVTVLDEVLLPRLDPSKDYGLVALTNEDLLCDMNDPLDYVYGLSSPLGTPKRVAIVSTRRVWKPEAVGPQLSALRLYKLVTHEIGHLIHLPHCQIHACNMNGVETVDQFDRHPLELCPHCMAKVCWVVRIHPRKRYQHMFDTCRKLGLAEAALYKQCLSALAEKA